MKVAIAGATGLTGHFCLRHLLENSKVSEVIVIGRRPTGQQHAKLKEVMLVEQKLNDPLVCDAFICCLGTTIKKAGSKEAFQVIDLGLPLYLAKHLKDQGCSTAAVISAMGANIKSSVFYNKTKGQMEEGMKAMGFKSLSLLRPSLIQGPRQEKRLGEDVAKVVMKVVDPLLIGPTRNYQSIEAEDIAKGLVEAVLEQKLGEKTYPSHQIKKLAARYEKSQQR